ncbi:flavoprotein-like protein [Lactarius quietus]|nr:flavoprotein-like protein [Lactarius quietus]
MTTLWKSILRSDLPPDIFEDLQYAVFGLGESSYENFCWPAKKLTRRLKQLGARSICRRAESDTQHTLGTDGAFEPWVSTPVDGLLSLLPLPPHLSPFKLPAEVLPTPRVTILRVTREDLRNECDLLLNDDRYHTFELTTKDSQEIFGPVLVVIKADTLDDGIQIINQNGTGTGRQSLPSRVRLHGNSSTM